eukprot:s42_g29.t1
MLADHKEQLAKLTGNLLFRNLVTCLEDACDKTFTHEAQVVEEGEPEVRDEELDEDDFQEELSAPEPSKEMKRLVMKMHQTTGHCSRRRLPRLMVPFVTDLGPEFTAHTFSEVCEFLDIYHSAAPVETPWRNGIVERAGGTFKTTVKHLVTEFSAVGYADMELVGTAATEAYNSDINDSGFSPSQSLFGRAPRKLGDVLGLRGRLAQHGLISRDLSFERQVAMREAARVAMVRLHFSRSLRRALLARGRVPNPEELEPGEIAYFWRKQKEERKLYQTAALDQWEEWMENCALEPLTMEQSNLMRSEIRAGAKHNLLTPRRPSRASARLENEEAIKSFGEIGEELGFGSISKGKFTFCGKNLAKHANGEVTVNMVEFDVAFRLCEVQTAKPTAATPLKACNLARDLKADPDFGLTFRNTNWQEGGLVAVSDATVGNINSDGSGDDPKTFSQNCYAVLLGGPKLVEGKRDTCNVLDFRSHKLQRVCRSSYGAETLGVEEALDAAELVRCLVAEARGTDIMKPGGQFAVCSVPLTVATDAKDTYDRVSKDRIWCTKIVGLDLGTTKAASSETTNVHQMDGHR